jgi:uncharacterized protein (DUF302 family)
LDAFACGSALGLTIAPKARIHSRLAYGTAHRLPANTPYNSTTIGRAETYAQETITGEQKMNKTNYAYSVKTDLPFDQAIAKATDELKKSGFGILTEIDVKDTLKKKIDLDFRRYRILGACNPHLASKALSAELEIGLLMPCNVIVYENDDHTATVSFLSPKAQFEATGRDDMGPLIDEAEGLIKKIAEQM